VCTDRLWVRVEFQDSPATAISARLIEDQDGDPRETDISDRFTIENGGADAYIGLPLVGRASLTVNGVTSTFERLDQGDPACPLCGDLEPSDDLLFDLVGDEMSAFVDPWDNVALIVEGTATSLGCISDEEPLFSPKADECRDCDTEHCEDVSYCGKGTSESGPLFQQAKGNRCLNEACFEHDKCYRNNCVAGSCWFTPQGSTGKCDENMFDRCDDTSCVGPKDFSAKTICAGAKFAKDKRNNDEDCQAPPCPEGTVCCQTRPTSVETMCEPPCQVRVYESDGRWAGKIKTMCRRCFVGCGSSIQCPDPYDESVTCNLGENAGANPGNICKCLE
jgi:hypothetical protein